MCCVPAPDPHLLRHREFSVENIYPSSASPSSRSAMSPNNVPPSSSNQSYLEQTVSLLSTVATYMRLPALASTVCTTSCCPTRLCCCLHDFLSSLLEHDTLPRRPPWLAELLLVQQRQTVLSGTPNPACIQPTLDLSERLSIPPSKNPSTI